MPYDKYSFLAGLAIGRNMESWPAFGGEKHIFKYTINVKTDGQRRGSSYIVFSGIIDWGDGATTTYNNIPANYNYEETARSSPLHTYAAAGEYTITLFGNLLDWSRHPRTSQQYIDSEDDYLLSIDTPFPPTMANRENFDLICCGEKKLRQLPGRLFQYCKSIKSLRNAFHGCDDLATVPHDLLHGAPSIESISSIFDASGLAVLPVDLLAQCPNIRYISYAFGRHEFHHGLPYTTIPEGFLDNQQLIEDVSGLFADSKITGIPPTLFANCPNLRGFGHTFYNCTEIYSAVPELWLMYPNATGYYCFFGCVNAANYQDIPILWRD